MSSSSSATNLLIFASEYAVNGSAIPDVDFDIGESYAGLMPIGLSNHTAYSNETDPSLYFWYFPSENAKADDEIVIWLNGGVSQVRSIFCFKSLHHVTRLVADHFYSQVVLLLKDSYRKMGLSFGNTELTNQFLIHTPGSI